MSSNYKILISTIMLTSCFTQPPANVIDKAQNIYSKKGTIQYKQVSSGESLKTISQKYSVSESKILEANGLKKGSEVMTGMSLILPISNDSNRFEETITTSTSDEEVKQTSLAPINDAKSSGLSNRSTDYNSAFEKGPLINKADESNSIEKKESLKPSEISIDSDSNHDLDLTKQDVSVENKNIVNSDNENYKLSHPLGITRFNWPLKGKIFSRYGKSGNKFNDGLNIKAPLGTPIEAIDNGKVIYIGKDTEGYGNLVIIKHEDGYLSAYAHLAEIKVERGSNISLGEVLGTVGKSGNVSEPQLHFSIRKGKKTIDPEAVFKN